ncbi:hypothetical protein Ahy_A06g028290 [Arachis hypogaea]|uniref:DUF641 domain-containing protein n=1 Tax=Arachis hypogaea TaxID=3818 RepID=A0A445CQQ7_ARAHY|nr:hypothetical protein Ahy_A06g028290 [Arachis hypogaea]
MISLCNLSLSFLLLRCVLSYLLQVGIQGMQIMKRQRPKEIHLSKSIANGAKKVNGTATETCLQLGLVSREDNVEVEMANWKVENLTFTIKQPVMGIPYLIMMSFEGIDKIFFAKDSRDDNVHNRGFCPSSKLVNKSLHKLTMEPTLTLFEEAAANSQEKINAFISDFGILESSGQQLTIAKELSQKIESMEGLLKQLRNKT